VQRNFKIASEKMLTLLPLKTVFGMLTVSRQVMVLGTLKHAILPLSEA